MCVICNFSQIYVIDSTSCHFYVALLPCGGAGEWRKKILHVVQDVYASNHPGIFLALCHPSHVDHFEIIGNPNLEMSEE